MTDLDLLRRHLLGYGGGGGRVLLGYSGGVDSALLAVVGTQALGPDRFLAVVGRSASYPEAQWRAAVEPARRYEVPLLEVDTQELADPRYLANSTDRCYFCKTELWSRLGGLARERGYAVMIDGTNADDLGEHRPGSGRQTSTGCARLSPSWGGARRRCARPRARSGRRPGTRRPLRASRAGWSTASRSHRGACGRWKTARHTCGDLASPAIYGCGLMSIPNGKLIYKYHS